MEKQLEDLLWLYSQSLSNKVTDRIFALIKKVCNLPSNLSDREVAVWINENHHNIYLIARDKPSTRGWIFTLERLDEELANLGIPN